MMFIERIKYLRLFITAFVFAVSTFFVSCSQEVKSSIDFDYDPNVIPAITTDSVTMLISDSGLIRYKVISKTWDIFDQAREPYWIFPDGFYAEQFDTTFHVVATIKADTVWNYTRQKLWKLKGNVFIKNNLGETFSTQELFWDMRSQQMYSNKYVEVNRPEKGILRGVGGFRSNQQMTQYQFYKSDKSQIYMKEDSEGGANK